MEGNHILSEAGQFLFRSGVVCWDTDHNVILLMHSETGEYSLPQAPCKWVPRSTYPVDGPTRLESFDDTATRIANHQLGYEALVDGYNCEPSLQPGGVRRTGQTANESPFLLDTFTSPQSGTTKITVWFLAEVTEGGDSHWRVDTSDRGEDWKVDTVPVHMALTKLPGHEAAILTKAAEAKAQNDAMQRPLNGRSTALDGPGASLAVGYKPASDLDWAALENALGIGI